MLSPTQIATLKAGMGASSTPIASPTQPATHDWVNSLTAPKAPAPASASPLDWAKGQASSAFQSGADQVKQGNAEVNSAGQDMYNHPVKGILKGAEGALKEGAGVVGAAFSGMAPLTAPIGAAVKGYSDFMQKLPGVGEAWQELANSKAGDVVQHVAEDTGNVATMAQVGAGFAGPKEVANTAADSIANPLKSAVEKVSEKVNGTPAEQAAKAQVEKTTQIEKTQAKAQAAIDNEVRNTAAKYPSVGKVLNKAEVTSKTEPIKVLSSYPEGKALPTLYKGKLQVDDATGFLKNQIQKLSEIKSKLVDTSVKNTSISDFQSRTNAIIDQQGWSAAKKAAMKADATKITNDWKETYPDGIPNKELDSLKTEHTAESTSYNSKTPFSLDAHGVVGKAARQLVESNSGDAPVGELNKLIQSHYDAVKLLNSMRGKTPHGGALSHMINNTIGEVSGLGAGMVVGHPFIGAMAGRAGAEAISDIINNHFISNPLKRSLVNNMKGADPAVVQQGLNFLEQDEAAHANRLALPGQPELGTEGNPRIAGSGADKSSVQSVPAQKMRPVADPKTGQMKKVYSSDARQGESTSSVQPKTPAKIDKESFPNPLIEKPNSQAGSINFFAKNLPRKIPSDDLGSMRDFVDLHDGSYRPSAEEAQRLTLDAHRLAERYGGKTFKTDASLANYLEKVVKTKTK